MVEVTKERKKRIAEFIEPLRVEPGIEGATWARTSTPATRPTGPKKKDGVELLQTGVALLAEYQARLAAQDTYGVLVVPAGARRGRQGRDDPPRHERGEPAGRARSAASRCPSAEELDHDYLWRYARRLPARGEIGIFNRSHYEEVLVVRVHPEILDRQKLPTDGEGRQDIWERRYREINDWERYLTDNGFRS